MKDDAELDERFLQRFAALKAEDRGALPPFGPMLARARVQVDDTRPLTVVVERAPAALAAPAWHRPQRRLLIWAGPLLAAAGLGAIWILPQRAADREFDRVVSEWSRTSAATHRSPTDGLLALPGSEFLGGLPPVGTGPGGAGRRGRS